MRSRNKSPFFLYHSIFGANTKQSLAPENMAEKMQAGKKAAAEKKKSEFKEILNDKTQSTIFRAMLRETGAIDLETLLYQNTTDKLPECPPEYSFPSDEKIKSYYSAQNNEYQCFSENENEIAQQQFVIFFKACKLIADYIEHNNNNENLTASEHAYKMLVLFGYGKNKNPFQYAEEYFRQHIQTDSRTPVHDALIYALPKHSSKHIKEWRMLIQKYGINAIKIFQQREAIENKLERAPNTMQEAKDAISSLRYTHYDKSPELADLLLQHCVSDENFNKCIEIEARRKSSDNFPDVCLHDENFPGYYFVKLPIDDKHAYILGYLTHCCMSVGENAERCVIDALTLEDNAMYVMLKQIKRSKSADPLIDGKINYKDFDITGAGYAWFSQMGNITFDSWENLRPTDDPAAVSLLKKFGEEITKNPDIIRATIGLGGKTPKEFQGKGFIKSEIMKQGFNYHDADKQALIYKDENKINALFEKLKSHARPVIWEYSDFRNNLNNILPEIRDIYSVIQVNEIMNFFSILLDEEKRKDILPSNNNSTEHKIIKHILNTIASYNSWGKIEIAYPSIRNAWNLIIPLQRIGCLKESLDYIYSLTETNLCGKISDAIHCIDILISESCLDQDNVKAWLSFESMEKDHLHKLYSYHDVHYHHHFDHSSSSAFCSAISLLNKEKILIDYYTNLLTKSNYPLLISLTLAIMTQCGINNMKNTDLLIEFDHEDKRQNIMNFLNLVECLEFLKNNNLLNNENFRKLISFSSSDIFSKTLENAPEIFISTLNPITVKPGRHGFFTDALTSTELESEDKIKNEDIDRDMRTSIKMLFDFDKTAYELLNIKPDATSAEIKKAYHHQAKIHHPDKNTNADKELIKYLNMAYKILTDTEGRKAYDQLLKTRKQKPGEVQRLKI